MINILLTSVGRRVGLVQAFREALGDSGLVIAADRDPTAPGLYVADTGVICPSVSESHYVPFLLEVVRERSIRAIVPLIDPELPILAHASDRFRALGCVVLTPDVEAVRISSDKYETALFFQEVGVPTARTTLPANYSPDSIPLPVIVKPRSGSSGFAVHVCNSLAEVQAACERVPDPIVQERLCGEEITVDVLGDLSGRVVHAVQRKRLKVRAGEVERGVTIRDPDVESIAIKVARALRPKGCINLQCFLTEKGPIFTEVNARFGGGYPLSLAAGADFPKLIVRALQGHPILPMFGQYDVGVVMMRYDSAVFRRAEELLR